MTIKEPKINELDYKKLMSCVLYPIYRPLQLWFCHQI
jgi:hypothetical protein